MAQRSVTLRLNDLIEAAGPSRLKTFESVIAAVYATPKVTSIIAAMHALPQTAWAETCLRNLNARASHPMIQVAPALFNSHDLFFFSLGNGPLCR